MKKTILAILLLNMFLAACDSKGPKGNVYIPERTSDEIAEEVYNAYENNDYFYEYDTDLYYKEDGEWKYYGKRSVYSNPADKDECDKWVQFGNTKQDAEYTDIGGYTFRVQYHGVYYYF